ncbi:hypothetical protein [Acidisphaera sp. L21]|jgi:hypothetical protein|uniref:hypothetical protein n=1 Tax=Acidisphaera sp. L21 TaxID=1641851 RepID=UPI00131DAD99|nr:hypothetical protein [Acidisphaera sp. L21]
MTDTKGRPVENASLAAERRRPGRRAVPAELIPLLRKPAGDGVLFEPLEPDVALRPGQDPVAPVRGIAMSLLFSVPFWGLVGLALHH